VFGVLLAAFLLVGVLSGVALASPPDAFTVTCPYAERGKGIDKAGEFSQTLPGKTRDKGSKTSLEKSAGGIDCVISESSE
jgi:hypothetical protein